MTKEQRQILADNERMFRRHYSCNMQKIERKERFIERRAEWRERHGIVRHKQPNNFWFSVEIVFANESRVVYRTNEYEKAMNRAKAYERLGKTVKVIG